MQIHSDLLQQAGQSPSVLGPHLASASSSGPAPFAGLLHQAAGALDLLNQEAETKVRGLLSGDGTDIHSAMIATEKAGLAFDAALAVRNKAVNAYQQIMGMQF